MKYVPIVSSLLAAGFAFGGGMAYATVSAGRSVDLVGTSSPAEPLTPSVPTLAVAHSGHYLAGSGLTDLPALTETTVAAIKLPPGTYALWAEAEIDSNGPAHRVHCSVVSGGSFYSDSAAQVGTNTLVTSEVSVTVSTATEFDFQCTPGLRSDHALRAFISARKVPAAQSK